MSCVSFAVADTATHRPRHHSPTSLFLTSCTPPPPQLSVAFAPTFPPSCYCCAPFRCIFFASLHRLFPFPMCHHGCTGLRVTRILEALNHAACRGRRDSPFFLVWRRRACRGRRETVFRVVRGGRSGRTVRANHISRRETSGTYEDRFRLIEQVFQPTHSQRKELCINTLASFYKRHLMSCSFLLNEQLINIE